MNKHMNYNHYNNNDNKITLNYYKVIALIISSGVSSILTVSIVISTFVRCKELAPIIFVDALGITCLISALIAVLIFIVALITRR